MFEIMFHGRGGQGAVLAATLLANTAARSGCQAQAFASYGAERRGGKVESYVRIAEEKIQVHSKLYQADLLILMDDSIAQNPQVAGNIKNGTTVLINTTKSAGEFPALKGGRIVTLDANKIASQKGLTLPSGMPIINTTVLGAAIALTPMLGIEQLVMSLQDGKVPSPEKNVEAAREAYRVTREALASPGMEKPSVGVITKAPVEHYPQYLTRMPPCTANCPAAEDIERTAYFVQNGLFEEALENIKAENPFPGICGRVCFHLCEEHCNRCEYDEGIATNALERAVFERADFKKLKRPEKKPDTSKTVAVIGSGPAGMTCAYYLTLSGHRVTVFESTSVAGGIPYWGIPEYRLPKKVVNQEIKEIVALGIDVKLNAMVGKDIAFEALTQNFDACFVATGAQSSLKLNIPGEELNGVLPGLPLLKDVNAGKKPEIGPKVVVIGGGNVAVDVAISALRLGAKDVTMVCLENREQMPAYKDEIAQAEEEGVRIISSRGVKRILGASGKVSGIELKACTSVYDKNGKFNPCYNEEETQKLEVDTVIEAIGQAPDLSFLKSSKVKSGRTIDVDPTTLGTNIPGVFAGGDVTNLSNSVVTAIASGKRAAVNIDLYLKNDKTTDVKSFVKSKTGAISMSRYLSGNKTNEYDGIVEYKDLNPSYFEHQPRIKAAKARARNKTVEFSENSPALSSKQAVAEAGRCFHCGRCTLCENCYIFCPDLAISLTPDNNSFSINRTQCKVCGICINECPRCALTWEGDGR
jgi:2-oxoacid:acceptor oxidoreductase gamma subunit (pyruvate/2-ketoisovalerate family)